MEFECTKCMKVGNRLLLAILCGYRSSVEVGVQQVFKEGNYSKEETIVFLLFRGLNVDD